MLPLFGECRPRHHQTLVCYQITVNYKAKIKKKKVEYPGQDVKHFS